jgi:hypothetical protein
MLLWQTIKNRGGGIMATNRSNKSKRGLASASKETRMRVAREGGKARQSMRRAQMGSA